MINGINLLKKISAYPGLDIRTIAVAPIDPPAFNADVNDAMVQFSRRCRCVMVRAGE
jgi:hypothetical protein